MQTEVCNLGGQGFSTDGQEVLRRASKPHFSRTLNGFLLSGISLMRCIAFRCEAGFGSTDFSLCAFPLVRKPKSHRLKPVLLDRAALTLCLHAVVKTPEENADFISRLKARPTKFKSVSEACLAAEANFGCGYAVRRTYNFRWERMGVYSPPVRRFLPGPWRINLWARPSRLSSHFDKRGRTKMALKITSHESDGISV